MPPKVKVTKEMILNAAFEITRAHGFSSVNARSIATQLNCSTQPIYRVYENMESLKQELYEKGKAFFAKQMYQQKNDMPLFLSMGFTYVTLAKKESHLFHFISMENNYSMTSMQDMVKDANEYESVLDVPGTNNITPKQMSDLFMMTWIFTHGIASMVATNAVTLTDEEIIQLITKAYKAFAFGKRIFDESSDF